MRDGLTFLCSSPRAGPSYLRHTLSMTAMRGSFTSQSPAWMAVSFHGTLTSLEPHVSDGRPTNIHRLIIFNPTGTTVLLHLD